MKFVVHSHHKMHWFGLFLLEWFLHHIRYACATYPRQFVIYTLFTIQNWSSFSVYMIPEWNFIPEQEFHSLGLKTGITCMGTKRLFWHRVKKYSKIILRWGELVPEWKSFWYHVNSPLLSIQTVHSALFSVRLSGSTFKCTISNLLWEQGMVGKRREQYLINFTNNIIKYFYFSHLPPSYYYKFWHPPPRYMRPS